MSLSVLWGPQGDEQSKAFWEKGGPGEGAVCWGPVRPRRRHPTHLPGKEVAGLGRAPVGEADRVSRPGEAPWGEGCRPGEGPWGGGGWRQRASSAGGGPCAPEQPPTPPCKDAATLPPRRCRLGPGQPDRGPRCQGVSRRVCSPPGPGAGEGVESVSQTHKSEHIVGAAFLFFSPKKKSIQHERQF